MLLMGQVQQPNNVGRYQIAFGKYKTSGYNDMGGAVSAESSYLIKIDTISGKTWEYVNQTTKGGSVLKGFSGLSDVIVEVKEQKY